MKLLTFSGLPCKIGIHDWISVPIRSITLANGRQLIVTESRCIRCGTGNDIR